jgi:hypothetical protein
MELVHPESQPSALYGPAPGKLIVDVGGIVSTMTATESVPDDVQERKVAVTR